MQLGADDLEGLFLDGGGRYIHEISNADYALKLLASGGGVDVMLYEIWADKPAHIVPGDKPDLMEFYFVLDGTVILKTDDEEAVLKKGEYFYVYNLKGNILLATRNGAKILYVSSQPVFGMLSEYYNDLYMLLKRSEAKDIHTHNHGLRVQTYSIKICERMKLSSDIIVALQISSLFHDIGKNNVPDEILNKKGTLTEEEYDCIKKHPEDSRRMLENKFDARIALIVAQHHEKLDGSGYPKGLKADEILIESKIIAVADAYDAMTSDRAYRKGLLPEHTMNELRKYAGTHYDPQIVESLYAILVDEGIITP